MKVNYVIQTPYSIKRDELDKCFYIVLSATHTFELYSRSTSGTMTRISLSFLCSFLILALFMTSQTSASSAKSTNGTSGLMETQKCNNVYFYEAPNSKIERMLQKVQKQLGHMQKDIDIIKGKKNAKKGIIIMRYFELPTI